MAELLPEESRIERVLIHSECELLHYRSSIEERGFEYPRILGEYALRQELKGYPTVVLTRLQRYTRVRRRYDSTFRNIVDVGEEDIRTANTYGYISIDDLYVQRPQLTTDHKPFTLVKDEADWDNFLESTHRSWEEFQQGTFSFYDNLGRLRTEYRGTAVKKSTKREDRSPKDHSKPKIYPSIVIDYFTADKQPHQWAAQFIDRRDFVKDLNVE